MVKIYRFCFDFYKGKLTKIIYEAEEKPKTYMIMRGWFKQRLHKDDVGQVTGYNKDELYLLEDDFEEARRLFITSLKNKIGSCHNRIDNIQGEINRYEKSLAALENLLEEELAESEE